MAVLAIVFGCAALALLVQLARCRAELGRLARQLEQLPPDSNGELSCSVRSKPFLSLCAAVNRWLQAGRCAAENGRNAERELKYTIASVSHDIRTPLTGAGGYLQLLETTDDPQKRAEYLGVVRRRLQDLEGLLDELFLYTRLSGGEYVPDCVPVQLYPALCEALAGFFEAFTAKGVEPQLRFENEAVWVKADAGAVRRIFRNLAGNALRYGCGEVLVEQAGAEVRFSNRVSAPGELHPEHLFDRFYRADKARSATSAGLGLAIVRQLMEKMGGSAAARLEGDRLVILLCFAQSAGPGPAEKEA